MNPKIKLSETESRLNRNDDITVSELRALGRFSSYSDEQLARLIESVKKLCLIFLNLHQRGVRLAK